MRSLTAEARNREIDVKKKRRTFYVDGSGMSPDGSGSGYAWIAEDGSKYGIKRRDGLTNNQAEYKALILLLKHLRPGSRVLVRSDSKLVVEQVQRKCECRDPKLFQLLARVRFIVGERDIELRVEWIPRSQNKADHLLRRS